MDSDALDAHLSTIEREEAELNARLEDPDALRRAARWFASHGHPVFPLHNPERTLDGPLACSCGQPCASPAKHPRTRRGLHDASTDVSDVDRWWGRWPKANIGLVTGVVYDVIDIDGRAGYASYAKLRHAECPAGCCEHTACPGDGVTIPTTYGRAATPRGGQHLYIAATGAGNGAGVWPGIDYRGVGGYVVAPPSLWVNGRRYFYTDPLTEPTRGGDAA